MSDGVALAKMRVNKALEALGGIRDGVSFSQSCVWSVVGNGVTMEGWTQLINASGKAMNADKAAGVLLASLEQLAVYYGVASMSRIAALRQESS